MVRKIVLLAQLLLLGTACGCAHARSSEQERASSNGEMTQPTPSAAVNPEAATMSCAGKVDVPASQPAVAEPDPLVALEAAIQRELQTGAWQGARISLVAAPALAGSPLVALEPDARRVPASNAKLLTTAAAAKALTGTYRFVTEVSSAKPGGPLYLWGTGDPLLNRRDLQRLAASIKARGVRSVRGIVVDDSHFPAQRLAPGFEAFSEGAYYRPTSGALNLDGNAMVVTVSAPRERRRPRVDVEPPSDYVKVRKLVRYSPTRRGSGLRERKVALRMEPRGAIMWLTISGEMGRQAAGWSTRRAVYDPALNAGWALRRALANAGVRVEGIVRRGRRPRGGQLLAQRSRSLKAVLRAANEHSDNLAAETLVRAMGTLDQGSCSGPAGSWQRGLCVMRQALAELGLSSFELGNGSGLHRRSWVTANTMVSLLQAVYRDESLRARLVGTLAVAGRSGTLAPRLRRTAAEGILHAKTGTLAGALALSGIIAPQSERPLTFSILVNGRSDAAVRAGIDRLALLLARYAQGLPLEDEQAPASQPAAPEPAMSASPQARAPELHQAARSLGFRSRAIATGQRIPADLLGCAR